MIKRLNFRDSDKRKIASRSSRTSQTDMLKKFTDLLMVLMMTEKSTPRPMLILARHPGGNIAGAVNLSVKDKFELYCYNAISANSSKFVSLRNQRPNMTPPSASNRLFF